MTREELLKNAKPILFNTEMVKAILDGRKTVTRRVINPKYKADEYGFNIWFNKEINDYVVEKCDEDECDFEQTRYVNPPYQAGDILYVRETSMIQSMKNFGKKVKMLFEADDSLIEFNVTEKEYERLSKWECFKKWLSPYWTTKETARIFLRVTNVRVEKLQDITEEQAEKEGANDYTSTPNGFFYIWDSTIQKKDIDCYGWNANPWVWVIEFKRIKEREQNDK